MELLSEVRTPTLNFALSREREREVKKIKKRYYAPTHPTGIKSMQQHSKTPVHRYANKQTYNDKKHRKKSNHAGDVGHHSFKDTTPSAQQNKLNVTSAKRRDILQNFRRLGKYKLCITTKVQSSTKYTPKQEY